MNVQVETAAEVATSSMHYQAYIDQVLLPFSHVDFFRDQAAFQARSNSYK